MFQPYDRETASPQDRVAWALCQIIDDDAPLHWTRYRFAASCIAMNAEVMSDLQDLLQQERPNAPKPEDCGCVRGTEDCVHHPRMPAAEAS